MSEFFRKPIVKTLMLKGKDAVSISNIEKKSTSGLTDTYEITLTDGTKKSFNVNNGKGIKSIAKTSTSGLTDTYTTTYNDDTTSTFTIKNGEKGDTGSVENLEVGGRNFLSGGENEISLSYPATDFESIINILNVSVPLYATNFVVSFEAKSTVDGDIIETYFYNPANVTMIESSSGKKIKYISDGRIETTLSTSWKRYWFKYTISEGGNTHGVVFARLQSYNGTGTVSLRHAKLETGYVPTDWTPSLDDIENTYATKSEVTKNTNDISSITSKVNAMNNVSSIITVANTLSAGTSASLGSNYQKTIYNIVVHNVDEKSSILFTIFGASIGADDESEFDIVNPAGASTLNGMCDVRITMSDGTPSAQLIRVFDLNGNDNTNSYRMSIYGIQIG